MGMNSDVKGVPHVPLGLDGKSSLKVDPTDPQAILSCGYNIERDKELSNNIDDDNARHLSLKTSLKKPSNGVPISGKNVAEHEPLDEDNFCGFMDRRKVQWKDACGKELAEIREFELSETGGSDEFDNGNGKTCSCKIM
ncbi:hypothetical protein Nepgr_018881 [Nepenthes gracilis]|uniref:Uncharacterized protein n=1 Tax=Nepenthes gracilis TaxID=150966 RepID=A0AAD3XUP4_NEPGR|nr:hypothetical protein Nepgr_018881 [Nepenthes gracilis]